MKRSEIQDPPPDFGLKACIRATEFLYSFLDRGWLDQVTFVPSAQTYTLNVNSSGATGVAITAGGPPSNYGGTTNYTRSGIPSGTSIDLPAPATATAGSATFSGWSGCTSTSNRNCRVSMTQDRTVTANYTSGSCSELVLENRTVTGTETHSSCRLTAGPAFTITTTGNATFRAGQRITLRPGFRVQAGGRFRARIDPSLAAAAATAAAPQARHAAPAAASASIAPPWPPATALTWSELPASLQARLRERDATVRDAQQSADGDLIVFATETALVWNDDNAHRDVYAYAANTDTLWLLSATPRGAAGAGPSHSPRLDGAGRHVIYLSTAGDLVAGPHNDHAQIYHHDLGFGSTARPPGNRSRLHNALMKPPAIGRSCLPSAAFLPDRDLLHAPKPRP